MKGLLFVLCLLTTHYATAQYTEVWTRTFQSIANSNSRGECLIVDGDGNVIVNGRLDSLATPRQAVIAYDAAGAEQWRHVNITLDHAFAWRLFLAPSGQYISTGHYEDNSGTNNLNYESFSPAGVLTGSAIYNSPSNFSGDEFDDAAMDSRGHVYMAGGFVPTPGNYRAGVVRFDSAGQFRWAASFANLPGWNAAEARDIALSGDTAVYLLAFNFTGFASVLKYDSAGVFKWQKQMPLAIDDDHNYMAVTDSGYIMVGGYKDNKCAVVKLNALGDTVWTRKFIPSVIAQNSVGQVTNVKTDAAGNTYALGVYTLFPADHSVLAKISPGGALLWSDTLLRVGNNYSDNNDQLLLSGEDIYVAVTDGTSSKLYRYDTAGNREIDTALVLTGLSQPQVASMSSRDGELYITGNAAIGFNIRRGFTSRLSFPLPVCSINTWLGTGGNSLWSNAQNWSCGTVPGVTTEVLIPGGSSIQIDLPVAVCNSLTFNCCGTVTLAGAGNALQVGSAFNNDGNLQLINLTVQVDN
jgi:hypothetical protein